MKNSNHKSKLARICCGFYISLKAVLQSCSAFIFQIFPGVVIWCIVLKINHCVGNIPVLISCGLVSLKLAKAWGNITKICRCMQIFRVGAGLIWEAKRFITDITFARKNFWLWIYHIAIAKDSLWRRQNQYHYWWSCFSLKFSSGCINISDFSSVMVGTVKDARGYDAPPSSNNCGELKNMFTVKMAQQKSGPGWNSNYKEASKAASTLSDGPCEMPNGHGRSLVFPPPNCPELENSSRSSTGHESTSKQRMVFFRVEIANKRVENIPVWADCQLAHVGAALGENESVQVLYYLYEKLLKESCNIEDANGKLICVYYIVLYFDVTCMYI